MCKYYNEQYGTNFLSIMPTNLYGINDNFDLKTSHVLPALIRKVYEASLIKSNIKLWGDGSPKREFLYVDDLANALIFLIKHYNYSDIGEFINIGTGKDITILELTNLISDIIGYKCEIIWDKSKPNGTPRKLLDVSRINSLGWKASTSLEIGIKKVFEYYKDTIK